MIKKTNTDQYTFKEVEELLLVHNHNRISVPLLMRDKVFQWYYLLQCHPREKRMEKTICFVYTWKSLKADEKHFVNTVMCAR